MWLYRDMWIMLWLLFELDCWKKNDQKKKMWFIRITVLGNSKMSSPTAISKNLKKHKNRKLSQLRHNEEMTNKSLRKIFHEGANRISKSTDRPSAIFPETDRVADVTRSFFCKGLVHGLELHFLSLSEFLENFEKHEPERFLETKFQKKFQKKKIKIDGAQIWKANFTNYRKIPVFFLTKIKWNFFIQVKNWLIYIF